MTVVTKALQRQLTLQISMWSMLALQDNPLMPVINDSLFQERLERHSPTNSGERTDGKYFYTAPFPFCNLLFSFKATDWSPAIHSGACQISLPGHPLVCLMGSAGHGRLCDAGSCLFSNSFSPMPIARLRYKVFWELSLY